MENNNNSNTHALVLAYVFGIPGVLGFLMQLGLGLWLASLVAIGLFALVIGFVAGVRVGSALRPKKPS